MIQYYKIKITKKNLMEMEESDRNYLILSGHVLNQLMLSVRLLTISASGHCTSQLEASLQEAQVMMLSRNLYSVLYESYNILKKESFSKYLEANLLPRLPDEIRSNIEIAIDNKNLAKIFSKVRNKASFHLPNTNDIASGFAAASEKLDWSMYAEFSLSNSFWGFSEQVLQAMTIEFEKESRSTSEYDFKALSRNEKEDRLESHDRFTKEAIITSETTQDIFQNICNGILTIYDLCVPSEYFQFTGVPSSREYRLPFFFDDKNGGKYNRTWLRKQGSIAKIKFP